MISIVASILVVLAILLLVRRRLIVGKAAEEMCKDLVGDLARSERERKIVVKAFVDACEEIDKLHKEKQSSWGIPDKM